MRSYIVVARQSFLLLRRDKIFIPAVIACLAVAIFSHIASSWGISNFRSIVMNVGSFGFHVTGVLMAMFWGVKCFLDSKQDGSLEVDLAAPISRPVWLLGRFTGLCLALISFAFVFITIWQLLLHLNNFGWMNEKEIFAFTFYVLIWLVISAWAFFYASFCGQAVATFATLFTWIVGLSSIFVAKTLNDTVDPYTSTIVTGVARIWNLQLLNLNEYATGLMLIEDSELILRGIYGVSLIFILITVSCIIFSARDVHR